MIFEKTLRLNRQIIEHRMRVRSVYSTPEGRQELFNLILDSGLLEPIGADRLAMRNYAIKKLQEMGMLDEAVIKGILRSWLNSSPEVSEAKRMNRKSEEPDVFAITVDDIKEK